MNIPGSPPHPDPHLLPTTTTIDNTQYTSCYRTCQYVSERWSLTSLAVVFRLMSHPRPTPTSLSTTLPIQAVPKCIHSYIQYQCLRLHL